MDRIPKCAMESYAMTKIEDGIWATAVTDPGLADFSIFDHRPYMYRVEFKDEYQGSTTHYRTDLHSRCQVGAGATNPSGALTPAAFLIWTASAVAPP